MTEIVEGIRTLTLGEAYDGMAEMIRRYGRDTPLVAVAPHGQFMQLAGLVASRMVDDRNPEREPRFFIGLAGPWINGTGGVVESRGEIDLESPQPLERPQSVLIITEREDVAPAISGAVFTDTPKPRDS